MCWRSTVSVRGPFLSDERGVCSREFSAIHQRAGICWDSIALWKKSSNSPRRLILIAPQDNASRKLHHFLSERMTGRSLRIMTCVLWIPCPSPLELQRPKCSNVTSLMKSMESVPGNLLCTASPTAIAIRRGSGVCYDFIKDCERRSIIQKTWHWRVRVLLDVSPSLLWRRPAWRCIGDDVVLARWPVKCFHALR